MKTRPLILTALFIAIAIILPFFTMQIPQFGRMLTPMHFPVIVAALYLGPVAGIIAGIVSPLLRTMIFGMPPLTMAVCMAVELAVYGLVAGLLKDRVSIYLNLLITMVSGRLFYTFAAMSLMSTPFIPTFTGLFTTAFIGIALQFLLIPQVIKRI